MPLQIRQVKEEEAPKPTASAKVNEELLALKNEMVKLGKGMVLEVEAGSAKAVRGTKVLVTRAGKELGARWRHWHVGTKVFAKPVEQAKRRARRKKTK